VHCPSAFTADFFPCSEPVFKTAKSHTCPPLNPNPKFTSDEPDVRDDIFDMGLELFGKAAMTPDCMISTRPTPNPPFAGCGSGVFFNMGLQKQQADDFAPDIYWAF